MYYSSEIVFLGVVHFRVVHGLGVSVLSITFCDRLRRGCKLTFTSAILSHLAKERFLWVSNELNLGKEKPVMGNTEPLMGITKPAEGLNKPSQGNVNGRIYFAAEGFIEDITRWREDMNFIFEWQNNILRTSAASE